MRRDRENVFEYFSSTNGLNFVGNAQFTIIIERLPANEQGYLNLTYVLSSATDV